MTPEHKNLLLKDLCARLPYGVKVQSTFYNCDGTIWKYENEILTAGLLVYKIDRYKPYLFPLSSMTEEQKEEISKRYNYHNHYEGCVEITYHSQGYWDDDTSCNLQDYLWLEDWYNKNHFDYRGLIPMGLANDATGKNIY